MAINWNSLSTQYPKGGVIAQLPSGGEGDGIGDLFSGLSSLVKGFGGGGQAPAPGQAVTPNPQAQSPLMNASGANNLMSLGNGPSLMAKGNASIFNNALHQVGLKEGNPILDSYLQKANPGLNPAQTPWCAGFVGSVLNSSGLKGTGSLAAKSYLKYGQPIQTPSQGDIAVFNDMSGNNDPARGHVGFIDSIDPSRGVVKVLGGNQGNSISIKEYPMSAVAGFRRPPTGEQVQQFARQNSIQSPEQLSKLPNQINSAPNTNYFPKGFNPELPHVMFGIQKNETGGAKNPYDSITNSGKNRQAIGKYQVMDSNVPSWTREALGYPLTPAQFRNNPEAQERTAAFKINQYVNKYGPQGAARAWFGGEGAVKGRDNVKDVLGTSVEGYEKTFNQNYLQSKTLSGQQNSLNDYGRTGPSPVPLGDPNAKTPPFAPGLPPLHTAQTQSPQMTLGPQMAMANPNQINWAILDQVFGKNKDGQGLHLDRSNTEKGQEFKDFMNMMGSNFNGDVL